MFSIKTFVVKPSAISEASYCSLIKPIVLTMTCKAVCCLLQPNYEPHLPLLLFSLTLTTQYVQFIAFLQLLPRPMLFPLPKCTFSNSLHLDPIQPGWLQIILRCLSSCGLFLLPPDKVKSPFVFFLQRFSTYITV